MDARPESSRFRPARWFVAPTVAAIRHAAPTFDLGETARIPVQPVRRREARRANALLVWRFPKGRVMTNVVVNFLALVVAVALLAAALMLAGGG